MAPSDSGRLVIRDRRLRHLVGRFERGDFDVLSLDVFDTLVSRCVPEAVDAFSLLGRHLAEIGLIDPGIEPDTFRELRRTAELRARGRHPNRTAPEVSIERIYAEFRGDAVLRDSPEVLAEAELAFEVGITFPDLGIIELAGLAQGTYGLKLAAVSDTYFSEEQLRRFLDRPCFADLRFDAVLTSSSRHTGKGQVLFRYLLDELEVPPERVIHVGDHPQSDVASPKRLGIRTAHFQKYPSDMAWVVSREAAVKEGHILQRSPRLDPINGDFGLGALRAKAGWQHSLEGADRDLAPYWQFGATTLGPILQGYAEWLHAQAHDLEVTTLWCLMREGRFLARLVTAAQAHTGSSVSARELWASRQAFSEATIEFGSRREIEPFIWRRRPVRVEQLLKTLGVPPESLAPSLASLLPVRLDERQARQTILSALTTDREVRDLIVDVSAEKRRRLLTYLTATVGELTGRFALVDLGWGGTIQSLLARATEIEGIDASFVGLYLVSGDAASQRILDGNPSHSYLAAGGTPETVARWVTRSPEALEQSCMADVGSLVGFTEAGEPVLGKNEEPERQRRQRGAVQDGAVYFQEHWARYSPFLPKGARQIEPGAREQLRAMLLRLVIEPMPSEAALFAGWLHDEGFGSTEVETMVAEDLADMGDHMTPTQFLSLPMSRVYWPFGLAALRNRALSAAAAAVASGAVPAGAFTSQYGVHVMIEVSDGGREWRRIYTIEAHCNVNGLRFIRWEGLVKATHVRLVFGHDPGVVRLDAARTLAQLPDGTSALVRYAEPDDFASVECASGLRLRPNAVLGAAAPPALVFTLSSNGTAYRSELELGFEMLPTGRVSSPGQLALEAGRKAARRALRLTTRSRAGADKSAKP